VLIAAVAEVVEVEYGAVIATEEAGFVAVHKLRVAAEA
jgi:hypothetical protein